MGCRGLDRNPRRSAELLLLGGGFTTTREWTILRIFSGQLPLLLMRLLVDPALEPNTTRFRCSHPVRKASGRLPTTCHPQIIHFLPVDH